MIQGGNLHAIHTDHLGRPIRMTSAAKATVWQAFYNPWGEPLSLSATIENNLRFPGQFFLIETGLAYNWHRHYDPTTGRYTQPDPLRFVDGPSVFAYAGGSPYVNVDPDGRAIPIAIGACLASPPCAAALAALTAATIGVVAHMISDDCNCDLKIPEPLEAKGGKQNIDNEYVREVQALSAAQCPDPCKYLKDKFDSEVDPLKRRKIKTAMKRFNCDNRNRFDKK